MFKIATIIGIVGMLLAMVLHFASRRGKLSGEPTEAQVCKLGILGKLIYLAIYVITGGCLAVLALSGFSATIGGGHPMNGYLLMLHCTAAPVFCVFLVALGIIQAEKNRFAKEDFQPGRCEAGWRKIFFWLTMLLGIPLILSMVISMLPIFGAQGQEFLYHLHRWSALAILIAICYMSFLATAFRRRSCGK